MITMEMLGKVKRLYSRGKKSLHEIAKTTGLSRNTIRKWVRQTKEQVKPTYRRKETANKLTAYSEALVLALKADAHRTKQNRRTAKALFVQIKAQGYTGGYSRVTDYRLPETAPFLVGKFALAEHYRKNKFNLPGLHAELVNRMTFGNKVIDQERVVGVQEKPIEVAAIFEVTPAGISKVWFVSGS